MKANNTYISLETAKLLKGCGVESEYKFFFDNYDEKELSCSISNNKHFLEYIIRTYPAFTWQEILWGHAEKFFGNTFIFESKDINGDNVNNFAWSYHSENILSLLQQLKYEEADEYFRESCILIKK